MKKALRAAQGSGTIRKKTVTRLGKEYTYWEARVTTGIDTGSGRQIQKSFSGKTQKEVREKMQAAAVALNEGSYFEPSKMTLARWMEIWLAEYTGDKKYLTVKHYTAQVNTHIKPALGAVKLSSLSSPQIQQFYNGMLNDPAHPLAPKSVRNIHGVLTKALSTAVKVGYLRTNPATLVTLPRVERKEIKPLTDAQVKALLAAADGDEFGSLFKVVVFTGLREAEAVGLTWDCMDFGTGTVKVCKQLQKRPKAAGGFVFAPLKNDKARTITPAPFVMDILKARQQEQAAQRLRAGELWEGWQSEKERQAALVFTNELGRHIHPQTVYNHFKKLAVQVGAPDACVHDLRHTFAVLSLQNGDDVKTVQGNLGHATAAFTLDVYGHVSEKMKADSAARMEGYIKGLVNL